MQLQCNFSTFPLRDLLDLCVRSMIAGAVEVDAPAAVHRVFVRAGRIYHAEGPREKGFEALWPLFELTDTAFHFRAGLSSPEHTIDERAPSLLARAQRTAGEWKAFRPVIASLDVVPRLIVPEDADMVKIDEEHWSILCLADGIRTIREIAVEAGVEHVDACRTLLRLHKRQLVRLDHQRRWDARLTAAEPRQPLFYAAPQESGNDAFFARLMAAIPPDQLQDGAREGQERSAQVEAIINILSAP